MQTESEIYEKMSKVAADLDGNQIKALLLKNYNDNEVPIEAISTLLDALEAKTSDTDFISFCNILEK